MPYSSHPHSLDQFLLFFVKTCAPGRATPMRLGINVTQKNRRLFLQRDNGQVNRPVPLLRAVLYVLRHSKVSLESPRQENTVWFINNIQANSSQQIKWWISICCRVHYCPWNEHVKYDYVSTYYQKSCGILAEPPNFFSPQFLIRVTQLPLPLQHGHGSNNRLPISPRERNTSWVLVSCDLLHKHGLSLSRWVWFWQIQENIVRITKSNSNEYCVCILKFLQMIFSEFLETECFRGQ